MRNTIHCLSRHLKHYQSLVQDLTSHFTTFNISPIPRLQNASSNLLANVASKLIPPGDYSPDRFSNELIFRPSILDNITNSHIFNIDREIITFLTYEGFYVDQIIDKDQHDNQLKQQTTTNSMPKFIVELEYLYDLKEKFKKPTNSKI